MKKPPEFIYFSIIPQNSGLAILIDADRQERNDDDCDCQIATVAIAIFDDVRQTDQRNRH